MACDIDALLLDGACYTCLTPKQQQLVRIALLCSVSEALGGGGGGGGGSTGFVTRGTGSPEGIVTGGAFLIYIDQTPGDVHLYVFVGTSGLNTGWQQLL